MYNETNFNDDLIDDLVDYPFDFSIVRRRLTSEVDNYFIIFIFITLVIIYFNRRVPLDRTKYRIERV